MKKCEKCGAVSNSKFCPECGESMENATPVIEELKTNSNDVTSKTPKKKSKKKKIFIVIIIILLLLFGLVLCTPTEDVSTGGEEYSTEETEDKFTTEADYTDVDYDDLARTPDGYVGDKVTASGEVVQVIEGDDQIDLRIAVNDDYDTIIYVYYDPDIVASRILEGDYVTYYGVSQGLYSYESTMGGKITIPLVHVQKISID